MNEKLGTPFKHSEVPSQTPKIHRRTMKINTTYK